MKLHQYIKVVVMDTILLISAGVMFSLVLIILLLFLLSRVAVSLMVFSACIIDKLQELRRKHNDSDSL